MLTFFIGLIVGGGLGALMMAFVSGAHNGDSIRDDPDVHHICDDCKYYNVPSKHWPCKDCIGDFYTPNEY